MMKKTIALLLCFMLVFTACGGDTAPSDESGDGFVEYKTVYYQELETVNYLYNSTSALMMLSYHIVDGLVEFDEYGVMIPSLPTSWDVDETNTVYTFHLREGVMWYTADGEEYAEVVADDFLAGMEWVLTPPNSYAANTIYNNIAGARAFYDGEADFSEVGIKAIDDHTLELTLIAPAPYFIKMLSFPCFYPVNRGFLEEMGEDFGTSADHLLSCGAYILKTWEPENNRTLVKNENYWNKDVISIDQMSYRYNKEATTIGPELILRGEINDYSVEALDASIVDEWMQDPVKQQYLQKNPATNMTYFMAFNFEPRFDAQYEPEAWTIAVNNLNFRKSFYHALDRVAAVMTIDPYNPEDLLTNTYTRRNLAQVGGVDYTMMGDLAKYAETDSFNADLALQFRDAAMAELEGQVSFPIKVMMPYNSGLSHAVNRAQVIQQQLTNLLGADYIDIELVSFPATDYNNATRGSGNFAFMETAWGPDFTDPLGMADPLSYTLAQSSAEKYGRIWQAEGELDDNGIPHYDNLLIAANAEVDDLATRYELFTEAEVYLLDQAYIIPFYLSGGGYRASYLDMFSGYCGQMGRNGATKIKAARLLDEPMTFEEYDAARAKFLQEQEAARIASPYN